MNDAIEETKIKNDTENPFEDIRLRDNKIKNSSEETEKFNEEQSEELEEDLESSPGLNLEDVPPPWDEQDNDSEQFNEEVPDKSDSTEEYTPSEVRQLIQSSDFDYEHLTYEDQVFLLEKEKELKNTVSTFATDMGRLLFEVQQRLKPYDGMFAEWYKLKGLSKSTVYRYISRYELIQNQPNEQMRQLLENMQLSLAFKLAEEGIPEELEEKILNLEITSNSEMQEWQERHNKKDNHRDTNFPDYVRTTRQHLENIVPELMQILGQFYQSSKPEDAVYRILEAIFPELESYFSALKEHYSELTDSTEEYTKQEKVAIENPL